MLYRQVNLSARIVVIRGQAPVSEGGGIDFEGPRRDLGPAHVKMESVILF